MAKSKILRQENEEKIIINDDCSKCSVCMMECPVDAIFEGAEKMEVDQRWRQYMEDRISEVNIDLNCTLGTVNITGKELLEMKTGDVLKLDQSPKDPLIISAKGLPKFTGYMGAYDNKKAVKIQDRICEE